jgi:hypothetical protein
VKERPRPGPKDASSPGWKMVQTAGVPSQLEHGGSTRQNGTGESYCRRTIRGSHHATAGCFSVRCGRNVTHRGFIWRDWVWPAQLSVGGGPERSKHRPQSQPAQIARCPQTKARRPFTDCRSSSSRLNPKRLKSFRWRNGLSYSDDSLTNHLMHLPSQKIVKQGIASCLICRCATLVLLSLLLPKFLQRCLLFLLIEHFVDISSSHSLLRLCRGKLALIAARRG